MSVCFTVQPLSEVHSNSANFANVFKLFLLSSLQTFVSTHKRSKEVALGKQTWTLDEGLPFEDERSPLFLPNSNATLPSFLLALLAPSAPTPRLPERSVNDILNGRSSESRGFKGGATRGDFTVVWYDMNPEPCIMWCVTT